MMKAETVKKFENLKKVIDMVGSDWWRFEDLRKIADKANLVIPCETTIRKYYNIKKRVYDYDFRRYTRFDGEDLFKRYDDEKEFEEMGWEDKIVNYLMGTLDEDYWEDEYCDEYDYWYDNGTDEYIDYQLGEKKD